jgi:molecular chaperone GrpE
MAKQKMKPVEEHEASPIPVEEGMEVIDLGAMDLPEEVVAVIDDLTSRLEEAIAARQRALADFKNLQRRSRDNEVHERAAGVSSIARALIPALDHFDLALLQDVEALTVEQLLDGVRIVREELTRALESQQVRAISPEIGAPFDPNLHQGMMRDHTDRQPPDTVVAVHQVGYAIGEMVLRPASVIVAAPLEGTESTPDTGDEMDVDEES